MNSTYGAPASSSASAVPSVAPASSSASVVHCFFLLDATGSMGSIREQTVKGLNSYISEQASNPGTMKLSLITFNSCAPFKVTVQSQDIHALKPLQLGQYQPKCGTPLYDAMAQTIEHAGNAAGDNPDVIVVVMTDGGENASRKFSQAKVFDKVEQMKKERGWTFVFLGANQDSMKTGGGIGIATKATASWRSDAAGTAEAYTRISHAMTRSRSQRTAMLRSSAPVSTRARSAAFEI
eukprot:CAMPEP_0119318922 /NCGR_PEP_ID=MMETSP1333-20130426/48013_1 /TAXON_ID=418940 /ORGANISM="Scyphosphaera apsteinii, Strain RCC1455" /LENGTH=236 /DNA_ID=CAMNT_0007325233 /DNA_START=169 /DNA_END=879 /DNA_ORIENTATION=+